MTSLVHWMGWQPDKYGLLWQSVDIADRLMVLITLSVFCSTESKPPINGTVLTIA